MRKTIRKAVCFLLVAFALCTAVAVTAAPPVFAADGVAAGAEDAAGSPRASSASGTAGTAGTAGAKELKLGVEATETFVGNKYFMSFNAPEDGYYGIDVNTIWEATDPDNPSQKFFPPFYVRFNSKDGSVLFEFIPGEWYSKGVKDTDNQLENRHEFRAEAFLHKGAYTAMFVTNYGGENTHAKLAVKLDRADAKYGHDKEQNNSSDTAISSQEDGVFQGYLGGYFETGEKDMEDWYMFQAPSAGTYPISIESLANSEDMTRHGQINCEIYDGATKQLVKRVATGYSEFDKMFTAQDEISFPNPGLYYLAVKFASTNTFGNNRCFSEYRIIMPGTIGAANQAGGTGQAGNLPRQPGSVPDVVICTPTAIGVKLDWTPSGDPGGYRIFRDGIPLNSGPVFGGSYVDYAAQSNKTYVYSVQPFEAGDGVSDSASAQASVSTEEINAPDGAEGYIIMQIDNKLMDANGQMVEIDPGRGTTPLISNGRTMVPIRAVIETMGGTVGWEDADQRVTLNAKGHTIEMWLERRDILVDGSASAVDVAPTTINERTMLPVRFVVENVGCAIEWIGSTQEIIIVY